MFSGLLNSTLLVNPVKMWNKINREYWVFIWHGIERIAMLKYQTNNSRLFSENDFRFLKQSGKFLAPYFTANFMGLELGISKK